MNKKKNDYTFYVLPTFLGVRILNEKALREDLGLTEEEINFMKLLEIFTYDEPLPVRENGKKTKKMITCDPISVSLYDAYYGSQILLDKGIEFISKETNLTPLVIIYQMSLCKSIFRKYNPDEYNYFF